MNEVFLNGAAFANNFGDILFFQIFSEISKEEGWQPTMYSTNNEIKNQLPNVKFYSKRIDAIKKAKKIAYVGGGYFGEQPSPNKISKIKWGINNVRKIQIFGILSIFYKKPIGIFGAGGGSVTNLVTRHAIGKIVNHSKITIVRDDETKKYLELYSKNKNIKLSVDTILGIRRILNNEKKNKKIILLHLSESPNLDEISEILWKDVQLFMEKYPEYSCTVITDHFKDGQKRNFDYFYELSKNNQQLSVFKYSNTRDLINIISDSEYIITNKLHVGIVGLSYDKKVIATPNHPKVINLFKQLGITDQLIEKNKVKRETLLSTMEELKNRNCILNTDIEKSAISNIEQFRSFLKQE